MSGARGRFTAAALGAACLVGGIGACSGPAPAPESAVQAAAVATPDPSSTSPTAAGSVPSATPSATSMTSTTSAPPPAPSAVAPTTGTGSTTAVTSRAPTTSRDTPPRSTPSAGGVSPAPAPTRTTPPAPTSTPSPPPPPAPSGTDAYESQILALVNAQRSAAGLRPLVAQACPDGFAEPWSPHMAAEGRLSHQSLSPVLSRCGAHAAAENVGMNSSASAADMVAGFMASPPHRANILGAGYTGVGIGAYRDARGVWWVTQDFVG